MMASSAELLRPALADSEMINPWRCLRSGQRIRVGVGKSPDHQGDNTG